MPELLIQFICIAFVLATTVQLFFWGLIFSRFAFYKPDEATLKKEEIGVHIKKLNKIKNKSKNK